MSLLRLNKPHAFRIKYFFLQTKIILNINYMVIIQIQWHGKINIAIWIFLWNIYCFHNKTTHYV
ncbi:hypothetical protein ACS33_15370 [Edwardsiella ictaluri]|nr:hypothetical protein ABY58_14160 [Edwardsiella ictaluri]KOO54209.1 hypothetical protein ACS33_15370 [Edwardsiella ictaluri]